MADVIAGSWGIEYGCPSSFFFFGTYPRAKNVFVLQQPGEKWQEQSQNLAKPCPNQVEWELDHQQSYQVLHTYQNQKLLI